MFNGPGPMEEVEASDGSWLPGSSNRYLMLGSQSQSVPDNGRRISSVLADISAFRYISTLVCFLYRGVSRSRG